VSLRWLLRMAGLARARTIGNVLGELQFHLARPQRLRMQREVAVALGRSGDDPSVPALLREAYRVLKPGSRFLCLEFSTVDVPGLDKIYDLFSFKVIPPLGRAVTGDAESYQYLVESIRKFPRPNAFAEMISAAGFARVKWQSLSGGIVALHSGWRL
jgi:SAM-dependent methyltransferase